MLCFRSHCNVWVVALEIFYANPHSCENQHSREPSNSHDDDLFCVSHVGRPQERFR